MEHQRHFTYKLESVYNVAVFTSTKTSPASFPPLLPFAKQQSLSYTEHSATCGNFSCCICWRLWLLLWLLLLLFFFLLFVG